MGCHILPSVASLSCCRVCALASSQGTQSPSFGSSSRNWPMFNIVRVGRQKLVAATSTVHCQWCLHLSMVQPVATMGHLPPSGFLHMLPTTWSLPTWDWAGPSLGNPSSHNTDWFQEKDSPHRSLLHSPVLWPGLLP